MGPNGSGKSTLAYVLAGKADYEVTEGEVLFDGENMLAMAPDERAAKGVFLAFQYPIEIPGVATMTFLRTALNAQRKKRGEAGAVDARIPEARARGRRQARHRPGHAAPRASMSASPAARRSATRSCRWRCSSRALACSTRPIPASTSTRSRSSPTASTGCARPSAASIVITHYQRLLDYIVPDIVHVLSKGRIVRTGGKELALELEASGYAQYPGRGGVSHERRSPSRSKTAAEQPLAAGSQPLRKRQAARPGVVAACARRRSAFRGARAAAPARRGVEIHRPARADARRQAARRAARCRREGAREGRRPSCSATVECRRLVFVDGAFVPELSDLAALEAGLTIRSHGAGAGQGRRGRHRTARQDRADGRRRGRAQHRLHGRRRRDPRRRRRGDRRGRSIWSSRRPATSRPRCSRARSS